jgi:ribonuclease HII
MDGIPTTPDLSLEIPLWQGGLTHVAGLDEAGRGAWAGPVTAAAVILPADCSILERLHGVRDSKCMTPKQRETWEKKIKQAVPGWGVGHASNHEIEEVGIVQATRFAMQRALAALSIHPDYLLLDAVVLSEETLPQTSLYKGDALSLSISAASVIAKTARDRLMAALDREYPLYGFARHKGYGTAQHRTNLHRLGPCEIHRATYQPVLNWRLDLAENDAIQPPRTSRQDIVCKT